MRLADMLRYFKQTTMESVAIWNTMSDPSFEKRRMESEIIRYTHSIEKGLSLDEPRLGFGGTKIREMQSYVERFIAAGGAGTDVCLQMARDALKEYIEYHAERNFTNDNIRYAVEFYNRLDEFVASSPTKMGGTRSVHSRDIPEAALQFGELVGSRHSVRAFEKTEVPEEKIFAAVEMAAKCPSACNRQGYHAYIIKKEHFHLLEDWLDGIGGFRDDADKFILITGRISAYRITERYQWVVSATVFASYLTLALHALNIGCCYVQRSISPNTKWSAIRKRLDIPKDEQAVCMLAIGNLKPTYSVPVSFRYSPEALCSVCKSAPDHI